MPPPRKSQLTPPWFSLAPKAKPAHTAPNPGRIRRAESLRPDFMVKGAGSRLCVALLPGCVWSHRNSFCSSIRWRGALNCVSQRESTNSSPRVPVNAALSRNRVLQM